MPSSTGGSTFHCANAKFSLLINLDSAVNLLCKPEAGVETNRSAEKAKCYGYHRHVRQVDHDRKSTDQVQLAAEEPERVKEQVNTSSGTVPERLPPPPVIFTAKLQVAHNDRYHRAGSDQDEQNGHEEAHHVKVLVQPKSRHDKEKLNADRTKGEDTTKEAREGHIGIERLLGNETGDLVGLGRDVGLLGTEAKVGTGKDKRRRDTDPKKEHGKDKPEGDGGSGVDEAEEDVQHSEHTNKQTGEGDGGSDSVSLPGGAVTELEETGRAVSGDGTAENIKEDDGRKGLSLLHGVDELEQGAQKNREEANSDLDTGTNGDAQGHGAEGGRAEDVTVDKLPACLLLRILDRLHLVVSGNVLAEGADHDGSNGTEEEEDDHERVDNGKVMNVIVGAADEVDVPTVGPLDVGPLPLHLVGVDDLVGFTRRAGSEAEVGGGIVDDLEGPVGVAGGDLGSRGDGVGLNLVLDGDGMDVEAGDADAVELGGILVVADSELEMVEQIQLIILEAGVAGGGLETEGISGFDRGMDMMCRRK